MHASLVDLVCQAPTSRDLPVLLGDACQAFPAVPCAKAGLAGVEGPERERECADLLQQNGLRAVSGSSRGSLLLRPIRQGQPSGRH
eukprot:1550167-Alexandrium_andersonii.AAC.1